MENTQIQNAEIQQKRKRGRPKKTEGEIVKTNKKRRFKQLGTFTANKYKMLKALEKHLGVVTPAAAEAGICREQHYFWLKNDSNYKAAVERLRDLVIDFCESHLYKRIGEGSDALTSFAMRCLAKHRGFVDKQSIEVDAKVATSLDLSGLSSQELEVLAGIGSKILSNKEAAEL